MNSWRRQPHFGKTWRPGADVRNFCNFEMRQLSRSKCKYGKVSRFFLSHWSFAIITFGAQNWTSFRLNYFLSPRKCIFQLEKGNFARNGDDEAQFS